MPKMSNCFPTIGGGRNPNDRRENEVMALFNVLGN